jgi:DNA topoisomerase-3
MKTLIIAEKPSVGMDIARVLGCRQKGEGWLANDEYIVSWALGHLAELMEPEDYDPAYKKWAAGALPILPDKFLTKPIVKTRAQFNMLKKLMNDKTVDKLICATDSGREGELIFRFIYELAKCRKPFKRLWISSMTDAAIKAGLANMKDGGEYDRLYASARCRAEADWLVGMNATRAYTLAYGTLLSVGRVQTPTLAMLVARQKEIDAFKPMDYWEVKATFKTGNGETYTGLWLNPAYEGSALRDRGTRNAESAMPPSNPPDPPASHGQPDAPAPLNRKPLESHRHRLDSEAAAKAIADKVAGRPGLIKDIKKEIKKALPPQLFDLTELQRECNKRLGFSAKKTLQIAQALYEKHKLITYPRTDSRFISQDMVEKLPRVVNAFAHSEHYKEAAEYLLSLQELPITPRIVNDAKVTDHHAIIPTGKATMPASMTADERAVYDRIVRNFLAAFHPAHTYEATTVRTTAEGEDFLSTGKVTLEEGWTKLYRHENSKQGRTASQASDTDEQTLPPLTKGEAVSTVKAQAIKKQTQPPKPHTEATLLSAMEHAGRVIEDEALKDEMKDSGLGTPATRAAIIERLIAVKYVERKSKSLIPTEKGIRLIEAVPAELRSPETTGKWERGLSRISRGEMDPARFMESIKRYVRFLVESAAANAR